MSYTIHYQTKQSTDCFKIKGENEYYRIYLHYFKDTYQTDKNNHTIDTSMLDIRISAKNPNLPEIQCVIPQNNHEGFIGIRTLSNLIPYTSIQEFHEHLTHAQKTIPLINNILRKFFEIDLLKKQTT